MLRGRASRSRELQSRAGDKREGSILSGASHFVRYFLLSPVIFLIFFSYLGKRVGRQAGRKAGRQAGRQAGR